MSEILMEGRERLCRSASILRSVELLPIPSPFADNHRLVRLQSSRRCCCWLRPRLLTTCRVLASQRSSFKFQCQSISLTKHLYSKRTTSTKVNQLAQFTRYPTTDHKGPRSSPQPGFVGTDCSITSESPYQLNDDPQGCDLLIHRRGPDDIEALSRVNLR